MVFDVRSFCLLLSYVVLVGVILGLLLELFGCVDYCNAYCDSLLGSGGGFVVPVVNLSGFNVSLG